MAVWWQCGSGVVAVWYLLLARPDASFVALNIIIKFDYMLELSASYLYVRVKFVIILHDCISIS